MWCRGLLQTKLPEMVQGTVGRSSQLPAVWRINGACSRLCKLQVASPTTRQPHQVPGACLRQARTAAVRHFSTRLAMSHPLALFCRRCGSQLTQQQTNDPILRRERLTARCAKIRAMQGKRIFDSHQQHFKENTASQIRSSSGQKFHVSCIPHRSVSAAYKDGPTTQRK